MQSDGGGAGSKLSRLFNSPLYIAVSLFSFYKEEVLEEACPLYDAELRSWLIGGMYTNTHAQCGTFDLTRLTSGNSLVVSTVETAQFRVVRM